MGLDWSRSNVTLHGCRYGTQLWDFGRQQFDLPFLAITRGQEVPLTALRHLCTITVTPIQAVSRRQLRYLGQPIIWDRVTQLLPPIHNYLRFETFFSEKRSTISWIPSFICTESWCHLVSRRSVRSTVSRFSQLLFRQANCILCHLSKVQTQVQMWKQDTKAKSSFKVKKSSWFIHGYENLQPFVHWKCIRLRVSILKWHIWGQLFHVFKGLHKARSHFCWRTDKQGESIITYWRQNEVCPSLVTLKFKLTFTEWMGSCFMHWWCLHLRRIAVVNQRREHVNSAWIVSSLWPERCN